MSIIKSRSSSCNNLDEMSADGLWDEVFACLNIDTDATIGVDGRALSNQPHDDTWLDDQVAISKVLGSILTLLMFIDHLLYFVIIFHVFVFIAQYIRYRITIYIILRNRQRQLIDWSKFIQPLMAQRAAIASRAAGDSIFRR